jgi:hypothetical protein
MITANELGSLTLPATTPDTKLNLKLIQAIADSELTLKAIAKAARLNIATIRNMCTNKHRPQKSTVHRLSSVLKKSPCELDLAPCTCLSCEAKAQTTNIAPNSVITDPEVLAAIRRGNEYSKRMTEQAWWAIYPSQTDTTDPADVPPVARECSCPTCINYEAMVSQQRGLLYCVLLFLILNMAVELMSWFQ